MRRGQRSGGGGGVNRSGPFDIVRLKRIDVARATVHDRGHGLTVIIRVGEAEHMSELVKRDTTHVVQRVSVRYRAKIAAIRVPADFAVEHDVGFDGDVITCRNKSSRH